MTPFRLLGDSALASLQERAAVILEEWRRAWFLSNALPVGTAIRVPGPDDLPAMKTRQWWFAEQEDRSCYVSLMEPGLAGLAQRLMGGKVGDHVHPLLTTVAKDALADLLHRFLRSSGPIGVPIAEAEAPTSMTRRGSGCSSIYVELDGVAIEIWLDAPATAALAPRTPPPEHPLVPRHSSLRGQRISLRIELDLGTISAERLQALQPGDVVITSTPLHTDFTVLLPKRGRIASGRLGRQGASRAVVLSN